MPQIDPEKRGKNRQLKHLILGLIMIESLYVLLTEGRRQKDRFHRLN